MNTEAILSLLNLFLPRIHAHQHICEIMRTAREKTFSFTREEWERLPELEKLHIDSLDFGEEMEFLMEFALARKGGLERQVSIVKEAT